MKSKSKKCDKVSIFEVVFQYHFPNDAMSTTLTGEVRMGTVKSFRLLRLPQFNV